MNRWLKCIKGDPEALLEMEKYNRQDIAASEELYLAMMPWMKSHPNLALYMKNKSDACYKCGSMDIEWLTNNDGSDKLYYTNVNKYSVYRCNHCKSIGRSRFSAMAKDERKFITSPVAR